MDGNVNNGLPFYSLELSNIPVFNKLREKSDCSRYSDGSYADLPLDFTVIVRLGSLVGSAFRDIRNLICLSILGKHYREASGSLLVLCYYLLFQCLCFLFRAG